MRRWKKRPLPDPLKIQKLEWELNMGGAPPKDAYFPSCPDAQRKLEDISKALLRTR